ncbi:PREDICTED: uncharacterized protein LOC104586495 [Nelumbo nucifera]|uniref:Uncharacterized protein LOC104586495 n=1 Tax=Nelumbo nucifera TaxID=4432 RepID=A0A1U7Z5G8_NELNU|nr:PREDICTED: uncharacterized protein LOC104586495 [Nelumbo nucifera]
MGTVGPTCFKLLVASLTEGVLAQVVGLSIAAEKAKTIADNLFAVSKSVAKEDLVLYVLSGLGSKYESLITAITNRTDADQLGINDVLGLLLSHESWLIQHNVSSKAPNVNIVANNNNNGKNNNNNSQFQNNKGNYGRDSGSGVTISLDKDKVEVEVIQLSIKYVTNPVMVHSSVTNGMTSCTKENITIILQIPRLRFIVVFDPAWYPDSGATHHMTPDADTLQNRSEFLGTDQVKVGNGEGLTIKSIGSSSLNHNHYQFNLKNIYHVPILTKNLIFVSKFTRDNNLVFEFRPDFFLLKDRMGRILLRGFNRDGLYQFLGANDDKENSAKALVGERASFRIGIIV